MADDLRTRAANLAQGTWRDTVLRDLRQARRHIEAALKAASDGDPAETATEASRAVQDASTGSAAAAGWKGAAEIVRLLEVPGD